MSRLPGLVAYGLLLAMAATSFDRTAAWLGPRAWKVLHLVGAIYLWGAFVNAFLVRALRMPGYWPAVVAAVAAMVLRIAAWRRGRRIPSPAAATGAIQHARGVFGAGLGSDRPTGGAGL
jgi:DMSO/TMAO reductase YedYZ heme-binding membrane subunit